MNILNIVEDIAKVDPEFEDRMSPRRSLIKNWAGFGQKIALAAAPLALSSVFKRAYGQTLPTTVAGVLNFALTLEYLEKTFYVTGVAKSGLIPASDMAGFTQITADETKHVTALETMLGSQKTAAPPALGYDFSGHGAVTDPFAGTGNYTIFLALSQAFEDTGVRAYKGQAGALLPSAVGSRAYLAAALGIHSVEARHASHIRALRRALGTASAKPWITAADNTGITAATANYAGEDNVSQGGVTITSLAGVSGNVSTTIATESFDEPLTMAQVLPLVTIFFKP